MPSSSTRVRVFLPTYRRGALLTRAIDSLCAQTMTDWVCELHNDDPSDEVPAAIVRARADPRFELHTHPRNLGPTATFNLFFRATHEPFYALLEDDNWWEPLFLERMLEALAAAPEARIAWCNQRVWMEGVDGSWTDTGRNVTPMSSDPRPRLVAWGDLRQALGGMHANGAMLVRSVPGEAFATPPVPFAWAEAFRERLFPHPLLYVPEPLAAFSVTQQSSRNRNVGEWTAFQIALLRTYVRHTVPTIIGTRQIWDAYRSQTPSPTNVFLMAALTTPECRPFLRYATVSDWARFLKTTIGRPMIAASILRILSTHHDWWEALESRMQETAARQPKAFRALHSEPHH